MPQLVVVSAGFARRIGSVAAWGLERFADAGCLWQLLGLVQENSGTWREALESLERASHLIPVDPPASFALAMCYVRDGRREMAVLVLRRLAVNSETPRWLLPMIASNLGNVHEHARTLAACRQILRRDTARISAWDFISASWDYRRSVVWNRSGERIISRREWVCYRIVIAGLLEDQGLDDEACEMLRGVEVSEARYPGALPQMKRLFANQRDLRGWGRCQMRLNQLNDTHCDCDDR